MIQSWTNAVDWTPSTMSPFRTFHTKVHSFVKVAPGLTKVVKRVGRVSFDVNTRENICAVIERYVSMPGLLCKSFVRFNSPLLPPMCPSMASRISRTLADREEVWRSYGAAKKPYTWFNRFYHLIKIVGTWRVSCCMCTKECCLE